MIRIASSTGAVFALSVVLVGVVPAIGAAQTSREAAIGKEVRVIGVDGSRGQGRLVSLSIADVVFQQEGKDVLIPLAQVSQVEKVSHRVRNGAVFGAIAGLVTGLAIYCGGGDETGCWPQGIALIAGLGAGAGTGIGAMVHAANAPSNLLYQTPATPGSVSVSPILSPRRRGVALTMRW